MERFIQYLDDIEDLVYAIALSRERIRQSLRFLVFLCASLVVQAGGVLLALASPPLAMGCAALALVGMLYRGVVHNVPLAVSAS